MDNLTLIKHIIEDHHKIGNNIKTIGGLLTDQEALNVLEKAYREWIPGRPDDSLKKPERLLATINRLKDSLEKHFIFEEKALPSMLGDLLMKALISQHNEIIREIDRALTMVSNTNVEGLRRDELLSRETRIQQAIGALCKTIEDHAQKEELILDMLHSSLTQDQ